MSTEYETEAIPAVRVHVDNAHELKPAAARPRDIAINTQTFTLKTSQTSDPVDSVVQRILDRDPYRVQALIMVTSGTVYICHSRAQAQAAALDASTVGTQQAGFLVAAGQYVPPLHTNDPVWAVVPTDKASAGAQVSVLAEIERR